MCQFLWCCPCLIFLTVFHYPHIIRVFVYNSFHTPDAHSTVCLPMTVTIQTMSNTTTSKVSNSHTHKILLLFLLFTFWQKLAWSGNQPNQNNIQNDRRSRQMIAGNRNYADPDKTFYFWCRSWSGSYPEFFTCWKIRFFSYIHSSASMLNFWCFLRGPCFLLSPICCPELKGQFHNKMHLSEPFWLYKSLPDCTFYNSPFLGCLTRFWSFRTVSLWKVALF